MIRILRRPVAADREHGNTLVIAMAVMGVTTTLGVLVVSQAVVTTKDAGKDRARMVQVHGAEGAVDAMYAALETSTPCRWPTTGQQVVNTAPDQTGVSVTITYYDKNNALLTCTNGAVTGGTATQALITATATSTAGIGTASKRTVQSKVLLTPATVTGNGAAIFAASSAMTTNTFSLTSSVTGVDADLWVDSGNVDCNTSVTVDGNLIVANGTVAISNGCRISKTLWTKKQLTINNANPSGLTTVGGSAYVAGGANATIAGGTKIGKDLLISGSLSTWSPALVVGGVIETASTRIPTYNQVGLPEVIYSPSDWSGFAVSDYGAWVRSNATANGAPAYSPAMSANTYQTDKCTLSGPNYSLNGPLVGPTVPTIFDTRLCTQTKYDNGVEIKLRSDMTIFAKDFYATGNFKVTSYDGLPHKFWIIVPDPDAVKDGVAECIAGQSGNIKVDSGANISSPVSTFMYTPCTLETNNNSTFYGQLYGGSVVLRNAMTMQYVSQGIPGVQFPSTAPVTSSGYRVDIVYKRETA
ncbi:MAG: hypothetical protein U0Q15_19030 [Kineosporiaceae bacterium]